MALTLEKWTGAAWSGISLTTERLHSFKLAIGYGQAARLTFSEHDEHHLTPLEPFTFVRFIDTDHHATDPVFLGSIEDADPGEDGHTINYVALDPTVRAANEVVVMSTAWTNATTPAAAAVPRLIVNAHIDADDDWQFCRNDPTVPLEIGEIIKILLDDAIEPLRAIFAAPADPALPYVQADLDALTYKPQEKVVFTSEPITAAINRILEQWEPEFRLRFDPVALQWRFDRLTTATQATLTLNDFTVSHPVLQLRFERSVEQRYAAVEFYGPEALENATVSTSGGGLNQIASKAVHASPFKAIPVAWQIDDAAKRRMGRLLPTPVYAGVEYNIGGTFVNAGFFTQSPILQGKFTASAHGTDGWTTFTGFRIDHTNGIIDFRPSVTGVTAPGGGIVGVHRRRPDLDPPFEEPADVRLIYPSFIAPLLKRVPTSGFEGTANSEYGLENVLRIYDEALAVGYLLNYPVTSATRLAAFEILGRKILDARKDVVYMGGCTLEGLDYTWLSLNKRLNFDGVDGDGAPKTTGWEAINAYLTDAEYDYTEQLTTLTFSADQLELTARDPEQIKAQLKLDAQHIRFALVGYVQFTTREGRTLFGTRLIGQDVTVSAAIVPFVFTPFFGAGTHRPDVLGVDFGLIEQPIFRT